MQTTIENYAKVFTDNGYLTKINHEKCFTVILNEFQDIVIGFQLYTASLDGIDLLFKDIYISEGFRRESIGFGRQKEPLKLFNDVKRRLIETEFQKKQYEYLKERFEDKQKYTSKRDSNLKEIEAIGLDLRVQNEKENYSIYLKDGYGKICVYDNSISLELRSLPSDLAIKILKICKEYEG